MSAHERWEELAAGHALDALEPEDEELFAAHLRGCDLCARSLSDLRSLAGQLAYAAEPTVPPESVRQAVLAGISDSDRPAVFPDAADLLPPVAPAQRRFPFRRSARGGAARGGARRGGVRGPAYRGRRRSRWPVAVAAVLAFVAGVWALSLRDQRDLARADADRLRQLTTVVNAPGTHTARLVNAGSERASVFLRPDRAWLVVDGFARNDRTTSIYVLWWQDDAGVMHPMAPFDVVKPGTNVIAELPVPVPAERIAALMISKEVGRRMPDRPSAAIVTGRLTI